MQEAHPRLDIHINIIQTQGDKNLNAPLHEIGGKAIFTAELEDALLRHHIDLAVHSLKDLPVEGCDLLTSLTVCPREDSRDVFISKFKCDLSDIPAGSIIGTSSPRRKVQILAVSGTASQYYSLPSWDQTKIPKLFSTIHIQFSRPFSGLKEAPNEIKEVSEFIDKNYSVLNHKVNK